MSEVKCFLLKSGMPLYGWTEDTNWQGSEWITLDCPFLVNKMKGPKGEHMLGITPFPDGVNGDKPFRLLASEVAGVGEVEQGVIDYASKVFNKTCIVVATIIPKEVKGV